MREIKFRAWNTSKSFGRSGGRQKELVYFGLENLDSEYIGINSTWIDEKTVLMQFTGLKDKNGKEIYEGDVVSWMNSSGETWSYAVKFEDGAFMVGPYYLNARSPEYRVIGNIYENPDLLPTPTNNK